MRPAFQHHYPILKAKIYDFPYSIYDLSKTVDIPVKTCTAFQTCFIISSLVQTDVKGIVIMLRAFDDGLGAVFN